MLCEGGGINAEGNVMAEFWGCFRKNAGDQPDQPLEKIVDDMPSADDVKLAVSHIVRGNGASFTRDWYPAENHGQWLAETTDGVYLIEQTGGDYPVTDP